MTTSCDVFDLHSGRPAGGGLDPAQVVAAPWRSFGGQAAIAGPVATVRCFHDNTFVRKVLSTPGRGRILVVDGAGSLSHALMGDAVGSLALENGWAGVVAHGAVRDSAALERLDLGVFALGTVPRPSRKEGFGAAGVVLDICGARIAPGDLLVADADGIVAVSGATKDLPHRAP
ncbi:ribonuclease E activity regulator RraA [Brachybacterium sp. JHP9]|uniref:4-hydroxy-4-methyl-2-oxoglutarate aldolase n=1 Tax=Brachybacterium equifaecis TaxID=2910770 RepID=A0ABT0R1P7_9MICO|nr:ribonuclease E activity regulator RraA [Brachybacterium equifaecis]MCL6423842.1 ribonuclease E activity regulator RraA [Brachybacterium equifaecis]